MQLKRAPAFLILYLNLSPAIKTQAFKFFSQIIGAHQNYSSQNMGLDVLLLANTRLGLL